MMTADHGEALVQEAKHLVRRECACLNRGDLDAWMTLFTHDGYYWMPLEPGQTTPQEHDSLIFDNRALMEMRCNNLGQPLSPSMQTPVRSVRILSDLEVEPLAGKSAAFQVSAWVIAAIYHRRQDMLAGSVTYTLVQSDGALRIRCKRVDLVNADGPLDAIMMYV